MDDENKENSSDNDSNVCGFLDTIDDKKDFYAMLMALKREQTEHILKMEQIYLRLVTWIGVNI